MSLLLHDPKVDMWGRFSRNASEVGENIESDHVEKRGNDDDSNNSVSK